MKNIEEKLARVAVFGTFLGHGIMAFYANPKWIPLLTTFGFSKHQALVLLPIIGILDIIIACIILLYPIRIVVLWAAIWAFMTALSRPLSGESIIEFVERSSNWGLPLLLLLIIGIPKHYKNWITV